MGEIRKKDSLFGSKTQNPSIEKKTVENTYVVIASTTWLHIVGTRRTN